MTLLLPVERRLPWHVRLLRWFTSVAGTSGRARLRVVPGSGSGGDRPTTLAELYHARRLSLVRLAILMVDDLPTAEDIVQDVFARLHRRHGSDLRGLEDPNAYLTAGVMNAARSALRRRRTARAYQPPPPAVVPAAEDQAMLRDGERQVIDALSSLSPRQRQVVVLRYWSGLSEQEIAETLQVSPGTVKSMASRALTALRRILEGAR